MLTTPERLAMLEERVRHVEGDLKEIKSKVEDMHSILMQARGAKWAIVALASVGGFFAGLASQVAPFFKWPTH